MHNYGTLKTKSINSLSFKSKNMLYGTRVYQELMFVYRVICHMSTQVRDTLVFSSFNFFNINEISDINCLFLELLKEFNDPWNV